jgi:hypothetical protein
MSGAGEHRGAVRVECVCCAGRYMSSTLPKFENMRFMPETLLQATYTHPQLSTPNANT